MTVRTETVLKTYFNIGDAPSETNLADFIESATRTRVRVATTSPVTVDVDDRVIVLDTTTLAAPFTVNLPAGADGKRITFIDRAIAATHNITLDGNAAETINGAATYVISTNRGRATIVWDGTGWLLESAA